MPSLLVIDDDRAVVHFIKSAFKNADLEVHSAATADEGLKLIRSAKPDVVLLDILLPQTTGLKLFETIREIDDGVPVIFITASGESDTAIEAMKLGAFDFLLKPLDVAKVKHLVDQALEIRRLTATPVEVPEMSTAAKGDQALIGRSPQMLEVYK